jgi:alkanesulfonate monooxygenase SsuD/methylene tetrahydromethanopterin reductase-like flavin-dependent oxidoreductase (luciferase family)
MMLRASAQAADGLLTAVDHDAGVRALRRGELEAAGRDPDSLDLGCTIVASVDEDREQGRDGAREIAGMYLANKVQNIQAAADTLLECAGLTQDEIRPGRGGDGVRRAPRREGGRLRRDPGQVQGRSPGRPRTASRRSEEYRDAGCTHVMLELWGDDRLGQLKLFAERVLPEVR